MEKEVKKGKFEKRFYEVLENIFLGKDIKSSSSPLIETKSKYYKQFRSDLQKYINDKSNVDCHENSCEFSRNDGAEEVNKTSCSNSEKVDSSNKAKKTRLNTEEIYEKLYDFSKSYFSQSGSVLYENTPKNSNIYADVFKKGFESDLKHLNESSEVSLFYKTKGLLYTKSEKVYKDISISVESYTFNFKVSSGSKNTNAKQYPHFTNANSSLLDTQEINKDSKDSKDSNEAQAQESTQTNLLNNQIDLKVTLENKEFSDSKVKELAKELALNSEILKEAIKKYRRTINIDFFINPSAESFLKEQLDLYLYKYFKNQALTQERINELAIIKDIALKLISYISKFESELAKIYKKPKFAKSVNYLVSLKTLKESGFDIKRLESSSGYKEQVKAWEALNINPKDSNALFAENNAPIDTRFFSDLKAEIKEAIKPQGTLIKSENYQALNSIKNAYKGKVKLIYIDPPYNTGNDDFIYVDKYNHSCWLSMMASRLEVARELLRDDGVIFIQCDDNEQAYLKVLCDEIYGRENFCGNIVWLKCNAQNDADTIQRNQEYILCYAKNVESQPIYQIKQEVKVKAFFDEKMQKYYYENNGFTSGNAKSDLNNHNLCGYSIYYNELTQDIKILQDYNIELARISNNENEVYETPNKDLLNQGYQCIRPPKRGSLLGRWVVSFEKFNNLIDDSKILIKKGKNGYSVLRKEWLDKKQVRTESGGGGIIRPY